MTKKETPLTGFQYDKRGKTTTNFWTNNNAKLRTSQDIHWLLLSAGYLPWLLMTLLIFFWSQVVTI
jgi:hypothetical protein